MPVRSESPCLRKPSFPQIFRRRHARQQRKRPLKMKRRKMHVLRYVRKRHRIFEMGFHIVDGGVDRPDPIHSVPLLSPQMINPIAAKILSRIALFCPSQTGICFLQEYLRSTLCRPCHQSESSRYERVIVVSFLSYRTACPFYSRSSHRSPPRPAANRNTASSACWLLPAEEGCFPRPDADSPEEPAIP